MLACSSSQQLMPGVIQEILCIACDVSLLRATVVKGREIQETPASNSPVTQAQTYNFPLVYL